MAPSGRSATADGLRNMSIWNIHAPPFIPSSMPTLPPAIRIPSATVSSSICPRENIRNVITKQWYTRLDGSNSQAAKSESPDQSPIYQPFVDATPTYGSNDFPLTGRSCMFTQPDGKLQLSSQSRKKKPSESIPLAEFVSLKLNAEETSKSNDHRQAGHSASRQVWKSRVPQKDTHKHDKAKADIPLGNTLDSSDPLLHKGKQRETPRKKYTRMKKVILSERMEQGSCTSQQESMATDDAVTKSAENGIFATEMPETSEEKVIDPTVSCDTQKYIRKKTQFRDNAMTEELDKSVIAVISELGRFQDRLYAKDPEKARTKKRLVYGLREVHKLLKVEKVKCVILAPNIESAKGEGGPDDMIANILAMCLQQSVPYFFALSKLKLGYVSHKHTPVSCAGILNYDGAEAQYKTMLECVSRTKETFVPPEE